MNKKSLRTRLRDALFEAIQDEIEKELEENESNFWEHAFDLLHASCPQKDTPIGSCVMNDCFKDCDDKEEESRLRSKACDFCREKYKGMEILLIKCLISEINI